MKTHSQENYHICPYIDCGKRYAHEYKLKNHIASQHEKPNNPFAQSAPVEVPKFTPPVEKPPKVTKPSSGAYGSASSDRPYACPYEGCEKAYIHEYKLKLHLKREHSEENQESTPAAHNPDHEMDEASDQDNYVAKRASNGKNPKPSRSKAASSRAAPSKSVKRKASSPAPAPMPVVKKPWPVKEEMYEEEDSEETEEENRENIEEGWRYTENDEEDDEETEYED